MICIAAVLKGLAKSLLGYFGFKGKDHLPRCVAHVPATEDILLNVLISLNDVANIATELASQGLLLLGCQCLLMGLSCP